MRLALLLGAAAAFQCFSASAEVIVQDPVLIISGHYRSPDGRVKEHKFPVEIKLAADGKLSGSWESWMEERLSDGSSHLDYFGNTFSGSWVIKDKTIRISVDDGGAFPDVDFGEINGLKIEIVKGEMAQESDAVRPYLPPPADSPIKMVVEALKVTEPGVEKRCSGNFTIRNIGPDYERSPTKIGPSYGVFIYDETGTMLFRNFGGWSGRNKSGESVIIRWNTNSNHLGETSEPAFLIPEPGKYELVVVVYPSQRDTMLCYAVKSFEVKADQ